MALLMVAEMQIRNVATNPLFKTEKVIKEK